LRSSCGSRIREEIVVRSFGFIAGRRKAALLLSLSSLVLLTACGGGDDSGTDLPVYLPDFAAPNPVDATVLTLGYALGTNILADTAALLATPKYQTTPVGIAWLQQFFDPNVPNNATQYPLQTSGAALAHAAGITGEGQLIAISDRDISPGHVSIAGRVTVDTNFLSPGTEHGTAVASVAAGNAAGFVGTAPGADILFGTWDDQSLADLGQRALSEGAVAWNNSWGYTDLGLDAAGFNAAFNNGSLDSADYLAALDAYSAQGVVVFSVSNDELDVLTNATLMDGLPWLRPSLEAGWLAVANGVPTFSGSEVTGIHLISNECWEAARWCLVADGTWNAATGSGSAYESVTGSSFAAPQVAGALALLAEAFPTLTPHELRIRLLASAEDDFFTADDTVELADGFFKGYSIIYGHGYLDIEAALRPIGQTTLAMQAGTSIQTDAPVLLSGSAMGDAVEISLKSTNVAVRDALAAGFAIPAEVLTSGARPGSQAGTLLAKSLRGNMSAERVSAPAALAEPFASFSDPVLKLVARDVSASASVMVPEGGSGSAGVTISGALTDGATKLELGLKVARENGQLMSLDGDNSALMASVALGVTQDLGGGAFLALSGEVGVTDLGGSTVFGDTGSARFDAVKLTAVRSDVFTKGDRLSVGVGLPVAIASGETVLDLPVMRDGVSAFEAVAIDLAPEDRQIDLELTYQAEVAKGLEMKLSLIQSENFGNRAGVTDTSGALAFAFRF
jgi:subtilase-type serine protease